MREEMKKECINRMKKLKFMPECIGAFKNGRIWESEGYGALYELNEKEQEMLKEFEQEHENCLVYHIIHNKFEFGECYSLLYVSSNKDEWEEDNEDLDNGLAFAYVKNIDDYLCSEFGRIGIKPNFGGLVRTS